MQSKKRVCKPSKLHSNSITMENSVARNINHTKHSALCIAFCSRACLFIKNPKSNQCETSPFLYIPLKCFVLCWTRFANTNNNFILKQIAKIHKNLAKLDCSCVKIAFKSKELQCFNANLKHRYDCATTCTNPLFSNAVSLKKWQCFLESKWQSIHSIILRVQNPIQWAKPNALASKAMVCSKLGNKECSDAKNAL